MRKHLRMTTILPVTMIALLMGFSTPIWASDDDSDGEEIPFSVAELYFELNSTDEDLGFHGLIDGEPWRSLEIENPQGREQARIQLKSSMRRQGLTELFFESAEPTFDELDPETFFGRFPEGLYEVSGTTIEGEDLESESEVTHLIPAPVPNLEVNGEAVSDDCDEDPGPTVSEPIIISWDEATLSHPELGRTNEPIEVVRYEAIVEQEDSSLKISILLPPDVTSIEMPSDLLEPGDVKVEVLVREASGNQTAIESCFVIEP